MSTSVDYDAGPSVEVGGLIHRYGDRTALADVSFSVAPGEVFGLLGPNGGGKSTLFRILATLLRPTAGWARIRGIDVVADPAGARRGLGVVFQHPSVDPQLTVEENLRAQGALYGVRGSVLRARVTALLGRFALEERRHDLVGRLSGGLMRRVEIAKGLLPEPAVVLMDEPSAGLDPAARRDLLTQVRRLRDEAGVTVLMTTHHMDEADRCDRVGVMDAGRLVAIGPPAQLKAQVGGDVVTIRTRRVAELGAALREAYGVHPEQADDGLRFEVPQAHAVVHSLIERFDGDVDAVSFGRPTLEDVFFRLTGHVWQGRQEQEGAGA